MTPFQKALDTLRAGIEKERNALNEEKSNLNMILASLSREEEDAIKREVMLDKKEQELLILQKYLASKKIFQKERDTLRAEIEKERSALNEEKSNLNMILAFLSKREEDALEREVMLDKKEQELLILQENLASEEYIRIFVISCTGKSTTYKVKSFDTIDKLKAMIEETEGLPSKQQRMIFSGKQLDGARTFQDYNVEENSTFHCVLRLCGC